MLLLLLLLLIDVASSCNQTGCSSDVDSPHVDCGGGCDGSPPIIKPPKCKNDKNLGLTDQDSVLYLIEKIKYGSYVVLVIIIIHIIVEIIQTFYKVHRMYQFYFGEGREQRLRMKEKRDERKIREAKEAIEEAKIADEEIMKKMEEGTATSDSSSSSLGLMMLE